MTPDPDTVQLNQDAAKWVHSKVAAHPLPTGHWNVYLRPVDAEQTRWCVYAAPRAGTRGNPATENGHIIVVATGSDRGAVSMAGQEWCATLNLGGTRFGSRDTAATWVGLRVAPCAIHGDACDILARCDIPGATGRCGILAHAHCDTRRDSKPGRDAARDTRRDSEVSQ